MAGRQPVTFKKGEYHYQKSLFSDVLPCFSFFPSITYSIRLFLYCLGWGHRSPLDRITKTQSEGIWSLDQGDEWSTNWNVFNKMEGDGVKEWILLLIITECLINILHFLYYILLLYYVIILMLFDFDVLIWEINSLYFYIVDSTFPLRGWKCV